MAKRSAASLFKAIAARIGAPVFFGPDGIAVIPLEVDDSGYLLVEAQLATAELLVLRVEVCRPSGEPRSTLASRLLELNAECPRVRWSFSGDGYVQVDTFIVLPEVRNIQQAVLNAIDELWREIHSHREELVALLTRATASFRVILTAMGERKIEVIKAVRDLTGLGLKEAKDLVEMVETIPQPVVGGLDRGAAETAAAKLRAAGASVDLTSADTAMTATANGPFTSTEANRQLRDLLDGKL